MDDQEDIIRRMNVDEHQQHQMTTLTRISSMLTRTDKRILNAPAEQNKDSEILNFHMKKVTESDIHLHANTCSVTFQSNAPQKYL